MKVEEYVYKGTNDDYVIPEERQMEMIKKLKDQIRKGTIGHFKILAIGQNDDEYDFLYKWLDEQNITIRGIDGTISGEIPNFEHTPKMGQSYLPEADLTPQRERELFKQLSEGDPKQRKEARDILIIKNMRLAKWVANWKMINELGIQEEDKDQMAMIGLMDAVDKFDWTRENKFSTYACKAISRRIIREWYMQSPIKAHTMEQLDDMHIAEEEIQSQLGRTATIEEIAQIMGVSSKKVREWQAIRSASDTKSFDEITADVKFEDVVGNIGDGDRIQMSDKNEGDYVLDGVYLEEPYALPFSVPGGTDSQYTPSIKILHETINNILDTLTEREADVIRMRFGMYDGNTHTLEECGAVFGVCKDRIRQIENKAIRKMRHPSRAKKVKDFYTENLGWEI